MAFIKEIKRGKRKHYVLCHTFIDDMGRKRQESIYIGIHPPRGPQRGLRWPGKASMSNDALQSKFGRANPPCSGNHQPDVRSVR